MDKAELLCELTRYIEARRHFLKACCPQRQRSNRDPLAEMSEQLVAIVLGGTVAELPTQPGWDVCLADGTKVQVKYVANSDGQRWVNEHTVAFADKYPEVSRYAVVVIADFEPKHVLVFRRERMEELYDKLGCYHKNRGTQVNLTGARYKKIIGDPAESASGVEVHHVVEERTMPYPSGALG